MIRIILLALLLPTVAIARITATTPLPRPDGAFAVGFVRSELTDTARKGVMTGDTDEARAIPAAIWYPARPSGRQTARPYFDAQETIDQARSLERNLGYAPGEFTEAAHVATHSVEGVDPAPGHFPIIIFSHGFFLYPGQNTAWAERLASHGYIVVSIGHLHDGVDYRLANGWLMPTLNEPGDNPAFVHILSTIAGDGSYDARTAALDGYADVLMADRLGRSLVAWVDDARFVARAVTNGQLPPAVARALRFGDRDRLVTAGMSFGGTTAASACRLIAHCVAAINLDGESFDPSLFDRPVGHPLLMLHSDWTQSDLWPGESTDAAFNPNDLAFERWTQAGTAPDILRLRLRNSRHLSFTDLPLLMHGPKSTKRFGTIPPDRATDAIGAVSLAFLDVYAKGAGHGEIDAALAAHPDFERHDAGPVARWAHAGDRHFELRCKTGCPDWMTGKAP
jgi:dienelactone hydrolase